MFNDHSFKMRYKTLICIKTCGTVISRLKQTPQVGIFLTNPI
jgi:hypothetical protein